MQQAAHPGGPSIEDRGPAPDMSPVDTLPRSSTAIIVNRQSGTVRTMGEAAVRHLVEEAFPADDAKVEILLIDGAEIDGAIRRIVAEGRTGRLIVGGGDGTLASAADLVAGTPMALGILPLGTMNLMAKTIGMAADPAAALAQLRDAEIRPVDAGRAGGRIFLHHVSFGLQPRIVKVREKLGYSSRLTKMLAGLRAVAAVLLSARSMRLWLALGGGEAVETRTPALAVSNNIYESSMMLKQARLDEGVLGVYALSPMTPGAFLRLALDLLRGRWRENLNVKERRATAVRIVRRRHYGRNARSIKATIDGELTLFDLPLLIESVPGAVQLLVPRQPAP